MEGLPAGFVLDKPAGASLPAGFVLDEPAAPPAPERTTGQKIARGVALPLKGLEDSIIETAGAIPDLFWSAWKAAGLPGGSEPGAATATMKALLMPGGDKLQPEGETEKTLYSAGKGAGDVASVLAPATGVARAARAGSGVQRAASTLAAQPAVQVAAGTAGGAVEGATDSKLAGAATAIGAPLAAGTARRVISPLVSRLTPQEQGLVAAARREGIELTLGQETGSRPMQAVESSLAQTIGSSGRQQDVFDRIRQQFNAAILRRAGVQGDRAAPEVLDTRFRELGQQFDDLAAQTTVRLDPQFETQVRNIARQYGRRLPTDQAPVFQSYIDDLDQAFQMMRQPGVRNVQVAGDVFQNMHSGLTSTMRQTTDQQLSAALGRLSNALDDAMERSMSPQLRGEWRETRRQYSNLMRVDEAMRAGTQADRAAGNVPFGAFTQAVRGADQAGFGRGRGELNELARIGDFLAAKIPNSGTPERSAAMRLVRGGAIPGMLAAGGAAGGATIGPEAMMAGGALATGLPAAIQRIINNPAARRYLGNQVMAGRGGPAPMGAIGGEQALDPIRQFLGAP